MLTRFFAIIAAAFSITGCSASLPRALDQIRPGMDKDAVLESAGNPERTFRESGEDHWIYVYYQNSQNWLRDVVFRDSKVSRVARPTQSAEGQDAR